MGYIHTDRAGRLAGTAGLLHKRGIIVKTIYACMVALFIGYLPVQAYADEEFLVQYLEAVETGDQAEINEAGDAVLARVLTEWDLTSEEKVDLVLDIAKQRADAEDNTSALAAYDRAVVLAEGFFGPTSLRLRPIYQARAAVKIALGDEDGAIEDLEASLAIAKGELGEDDPSLRDELSVLAELDGSGFVSTTGYKAELEELEEQTQVRQGTVEAMSGGTAVDQCTSDGEDQAFQRIEVYYGTNRKPSGRTSPSAFYKNVYDDTGTVRYGATYVTLPCNRELGAIPSPRWWRGEFRPTKSKHVVLEDVRPIDSVSAFWAETKERMAGSGRKEALVFIHGFNVTFEGAAQRTAQLAADFELDGVPFFYDWPSRGSMFRYTADRDLVGAALFKSLATFLQGVAEKTGAERVHVIAHSLGNEFLLGALKELDDNQYRDVTEPPFSEVIFASPDVAVTDFKALAAETKRLADRMTLYASQEDKALWFSSWQAKMRRAGSAAEKVVVAGIDSIDTSKASAGFVGHSDFAGNGLDDLRSVVWHSLKPDSRCVLEPKPVEDLKIWEFAPRCEDTVFKAAIVTIRRLGFAETIRLIENQISLTEEAGEMEQTARWRSVLEQVRIMEPELR